VGAVAAFLAKHPEMEVVFCCFGQDSADLHEHALAALAGRD
jgi:hypothetical protein